MTNEATITRTPNPDYRPRMNHGKDPMWMKVGRSEYMRGDGVTIRKDNNSGEWRVYLPNGEQPQTFGMFGNRSGYANVPVTAPSLEYAKMAAAEVRADAPAFIRR